MISVYEGIYITTRRKVQTILISVNKLLEICPHILSREKMMKKNRNFKGKITALLEKALNAITDPNGEILQK